MRIKAHRQQPEPDNAQEPPSCMPYLRLTILGPAPTRLCATVVDGQRTPWWRINCSHLSRESLPYLFMDQAEMYSAAEYSIGHTRTAEWAVNALITARRAADPGGNLVAQGDRLVSRRTDHYVHGWPDEEEWQRRDRLPLGSAGLHVIRLGARVQVLAGKTLEWTWQAGLRCGCD